MAASADAVKAALESGVWREREDPKTGRKYYVNVQTKASVWNLAKELAKEKSAATSQSHSAVGSPTSGAGYKFTSTVKLVDERHERARRWQEEEAHLMQYIVSLEQEKVKLESEVSTMQGPVEAEALALREEYDKLSDAKASLEAVVSEALKLRTQKATELQKLTNQAEQLRLERQHDWHAYESLKKRHVRLLEEKNELMSDLLRETQASVKLEETYEAEKRRLSSVLAEEQRQKRLVELREAEVARAREDLVDLCKQKAAREAYYEELKAELDAEEAKAQSGGDWAHNAGQKRSLPRESTPALSRELVAVAAAPGDGAAPCESTATDALHAELLQQVETKQRELQLIQSRKQRQLEVEEFAFQNDALRAVTSRADRDAQKLRQVTDELERYADQIGALVKQCKKDLDVLVEEQRVRRVV